MDLSLSCLLIPDNRWYLLSWHLRWLLGWWLLKDGTTECLRLQRPGISLARHVICDLDIIVQCTIMHARYYSSRRFLNCLYIYSVATLYNFVMLSDLSLLFIAQPLWYDWFNDLVMFNTVGETLPIKFLCWLFCELSRMICCTQNCGTK